MEVSKDKLNNKYTGIRRGLLIGRRPFGLLGSDWPADRQALHWPRLRVIALYKLALFSRGITILVSFSRSVLDKYGAVLQLDVHFQRGRPDKRQS
jgi:hypothetical protein